MAEAYNYDTDTVSSRLKRRWAGDQGPWNMPGLSVPKSWLKQHRFHKPKVPIQSRKVKSGHRTAGEEAA